MNTTGYCNQEKPLCKIIHIHATGINLGDQAIIEAIYRLIGKCEVLYYDITSYTLSNDKIYGYCNDFNMEQILRNISRSNGLLIGGGDLITSWEFTYICILLARIYKVPVFIVGIGVDLKKIDRITSLLARIALRVPEVFYIRDSRSYQLLKSIGVKKSRMISTSDLVFTLPFSKYKIRNDFIAFSKYVVISLRAPEYTSLEWNEKQYKEIAIALDEIIKKHDYVLVFLPMLSSKQNARRLNDMEADDISFDIVRKNMKYSNSTMVLKDLNNFHDALKIIGGSEFLIGARLHSLIFATLMEIPFIPLSYGGKTDSYIKEIGLSKIAIHMDDITSEKLLSSIEYVYKNSEKVKKIIILNKHKMIKMAGSYKTFLSYIYRLRTKKPSFMRFRKILSYFFLFTIKKIYNL